MMSYYYCRNCGDYMDEMEATCFIPEIHYELDNKPTEMIAVNQCIYCGSDDLVEAGFCYECGDVVAASALDDGVCRQCRKRSVKYG